MLTYPRDYLMVERGQFWFRNIGQPRTDINDDALRQEVRIVIVEVEKVIRGPCHYLHVESARTYRRGRLWIGAAHLGDVYASANIELALEVAHWF